MKLQYMLRVDFENGLHIEFSYDNLNACAAAGGAIFEAKRDESMVEISDDMGRGATIDGTKVVHFMTVDLELEAAGKVHLSYLIESTQQATAAALKAGALAQVQRPPLVMPTGAPLLPTGRRGLNGG